MMSIDEIALYLWLIFIISAVVGFIYFFTELW
jgi:hypothetical protein